MSKKLIIAEKPSVAADIARALGGFTKHDDYFESDDFVLSSAVGHLLELACPEEYEVKRGKWSFAHLPVIPPHFALKPIEKSESRLKLLTKLIKRKDVTTLVNACDAGREGELIFNYIAQHAKSGKGVQRLWLQSMTQQAIRDGFAGLRDGSEMKGLADAAVCRSESDWLVGINGTRAMTAFNSKTGGFHLTTVGRVQTPTLALLVEREDKIRRFKPRPYWELEGVFSCAAGEYRGKWFDEDFTKGKGEEDEHLRADRLWDEARAKALQGKCTNKPGVVTEEAKPSSQLSPLLYDLTSLQREANSRFGFSAKATLGLAQALCGDPDVLVLDEPTVGLDPKQITEIRALIRRLSAGRTIVFSSHNLAEVRQLCDRVVILHHGEVKLDAAIGDVGENDTVTLLCTVQGSEKRLVASMSHLDGVRAVNVQPGSGEDEVSLSLLFDKTAMPEKQVFTLCSAMSAPILRLARCEDDLEQVFLKAISD